MKKQLNKFFFAFGVFLLVLGCSDDSDKKTEQIVKSQEGLNEKSDSVKKDEKQPDLKSELNNISFPSKPDKKSIVTYILKILILSQDLNRYSPEDQQIDMLAKIGEQYIDVLLDFGNNKSIAGRFYINHAIARIATESSKNKIIENLRLNEDLAKVVLKNGWQVEARDIMIEKLYKERFVPKELIQAVVKLEDPLTYDALIYFFVHGTNQYNTYGLTYKLPGININNHIIEAWEITLATRTNYEKMLMAELAIRLGRKDALEILIEGLYEFKSPTLNDRFLKILKEYVDIKGDLSAIAEWYNTNKNNIIFDVATKKFVLKKQKAT